ncbi:MAG: M28 family peptidase, partial [Pontiella sp.]
MFSARKIKELPLWAKLLRTLSVLIICFFGIFLLTTQPLKTCYPPTERQVYPLKLRGHVESLSEQFSPRNFKSIWNLDKCAYYISDHFRQTGAEVSEQTYEVNGQAYRNVIATYCAGTGARIVVGAHYDSCQDTPGADDNASGIAGLIELAYLLGQTELTQHVELVAYTLEEPPYFRTGDMGSARHAYSLRQKNVEIDAMICLEMIGYFSDEKGSQQFPSAILKLFYPDKGNFISVIGSIGDRK